MTHSIVDHQHPELPSTSVEGKQRRFRLHIPIVLDMSTIIAGDPSERAAKLTLAPGSTAPDAKAIAEKCLSEAASSIGVRGGKVQPEWLLSAVGLQWRDGIVWRSFDTLEHMSEHRIRNRWMLKTQRNPHLEPGVLDGLDDVAQGPLKDHWENRGEFIPADREVSAWSTFLSSYRDELLSGGKSKALLGTTAELCGKKTSKVQPEKGAKKRPTNYAAMTSKKTERVAVAGGVPLPKALLTGTGRKKAAVLLAVTKNARLNLRFIPNHGRERDFVDFVEAPSSSAYSSRADTPTTGTLSRHYSAFGIPRAAPMTPHVGSLTNSSATGALSPLQSRPRLSTSTELGTRKGPSFKVSGF
mmetsp:Transcript_24435/g.55086  ORF Transcript_24435/g.55086 Transcript_24435/m.55086 type:complete len:356 (-) Transcript_24435:244-1311(-)|eukprot:CAMPEP_0172585694 /NCGR_PEP_ID=MMETSP1068-20121228/5084_1 /TAXON_ID=35684 /ORGANISM="Pseudopedinella elastica, Strain CCMP716" /LENGTH=355 /DNA_ID=CAMNT_0013380243 /DNA_START=176 /DNA_END=1243 /DNA_ORIENTATION=-